LPSYYHRNRVYRKSNSQARFFCTDLFVEVNTRVSFSDFEVNTHGQNVIGVLERDSVRSPLSIGYLRGRVVTDCACVAPGLSIVGVDDLRNHLAVEVDRSADLQR
jgi:hypothetical protein